MKKATLLSSLCLMTLLTLFPLWTKAQNPDITGTVRAESGEPMPFAAIAVFSGSDTTRILKSSVTDQAGEYVVRDIVAGDYRIAASSLGFGVSQKDITVGTENVNVDFVMAESAVAMDGVTVRGKRTIDFADRSVYTFSDAQVKKARQLADLVATVRDLDTDPQTGRIVRRRRRPETAAQRTQCHGKRPEEYPCGKDSESRILHHPAGEICGGGNRREHHNQEA